MSTTLNLTKAQRRMIERTKEAGGTKEFDGRSLMAIEALEELGLITVERCIIVTLTDAGWAI